MSNTLLPNTYTPCTTQNNVCDIPSPGSYVVAYKSNNNTGNIHFRDTNKSIECNNYIFGDPAANTEKECLIMPFPKSMTSLQFDPNTGLPVASSGYQHCADELSTCDPSKLDSSIGNNPVDILFGTNGKFVYSNIIGPVDCSTTIFGDPAPNSHKVCLWRPSSISPSHGPTPPTPSPTPSPPTPSPSTPSIIIPIFPQPSPSIIPKSKIGLIIGLIVGFVLILIIIIIIIAMSKKKHNKK